MLNIWYFNAFWSVSTCSISKAVRGELGSAIAAEEVALVARRLAMLSRRRRRSLVWMFAIYTRGFGDGGRNEEEGGGLLSSFSNNPLSLPFPPPFHPAAGASHSAFGAARCWIYGLEYGKCLSGTMKNGERLTH